MTTKQLNIAEISNALNTAFDDSELSSFCLNFFYFRKVYDKFGQGMGKDYKITLLLDHCRRRSTGFKTLLDCVRKEYEISNFDREELIPLINALEAYTRPSSSERDKPNNGNDVKPDLERLKWQALEAEIKSNLELAEKLWIQILDLSGGNDVTATKALERIETKRKQSSKRSMPLPPEIESGEPEEPVDETYLTELHNLLKAGKWKEADLETAKVILKIANRQENERLRTQDIKEFPCSYIQAIDNLWQNHSNHRFGFTVQRQIWLEVVGQTGQFSGKNFRKFGDRVGWRVDRKWLRGYDGFIFTSDAPEGHLPSLRLPAFKDDPGWRQPWERMFKRFVVEYRNLLI